MLLKRRFYVGGVQFTYHETCYSLGEDLGSVLPMQRPPEPRCGFTGVLPGESTIMSTRLSTEMTWEKPSTRRFAPPGGKSSISLGNYSEPPPPPPQAPPAPAPAFAPGTKPAVQGSVEERISNGSKSSSKSPPAKAALSVAVPSPLGGRRVGLAVCQAASLKAATVAELDKLGAKTTVYDVMDPLQLPFATQCLVNNASADVVIVVGFLIKDAHWCSSEVAGSLVKTLLDLSLEAKVPVVNGLCFSRVMESDAVKLAERLAWGAVNMNALSQAGADSCAVSFPSSSEAAANGTTPASTSRSVGSKSKRVSSVFKQQREIPRELSSLLLGLRTSLKNLGTTAIFQLARRFRQADSNKSGSVNFHEFQVCMRNAHMDWTEDELNNVYEHFDTSGSGGISYDEFIMGVRGEVSGRRAQLVLLVFQLADKNKDGVVSVGDVKDMYDASQHPDVLESKRTEEEVMEEFIGTFDGEVKDGKVTPEEWCRYYSMVSASIDSDDYFELMMRNAWHIPGGEGACANTTIKRVLATHADGRQTVEEVQDGPFFDNGDNEAMLESLRAQGLNVSNVDMFGTVDSTEVAAVEKPADIPRPSASAIDPKFLPFVRQGPGGNSTIVLG